MKCSYLLPLLGLMALVSPSNAQPKPTTQASKPIFPTALKTIPPEVKDMVPTRATTLYLGVLPMGVRGKPTLVHLWVAGRRLPGSVHQFEPSPFCVDLFQRDDDRGTPGFWYRVTSTVYLGEDAPFADSRGVALRWLQPARKQNPVLVFVSSSYIWTRFTIITYPQGVRFGEATPSQVQEFDQGGAGGGRIDYNFGVDKRGLMTVLEDSWYLNSLKSRKVFAWNGREYAAPPAK